jgi:hypothetical protein
MAIAAGKRSSLGRKYLSSTISKVVNNSSYNLGLVVLSSLMIMGLGKYLWSHVDLRTNPHTFSNVTFFQLRGLDPEI